MHRNSLDSLNSFEMYLSNTLIVIVVFHLGFDCCSYSNARFSFTFMKPTRSLLLSPPSNSIRDRLIICTFFCESFEYPFFLIHIFRFLNYVINVYLFSSHFSSCHLKWNAVKIFVVVVFYFIFSTKVQRE